MTLGTRQANHLSCPRAASSLVTLPRRYVDEIPSDDMLISNASPKSAPKMNNSNRTPSTEHQYGVLPPTIRARPVFATVFLADSHAIIDELGSDRISPQKAAKRLMSLKLNLEDHVIHRRPIPGTLPSERYV